LIVKIPFKNYCNRIVIRIAIIINQLVLYHTTPKKINQNSSTF